MSIGLQVVGDVESDVVVLGQASSAVIIAKATAYLLGRGLVQAGADGPTRANALAQRAVELLVADYREWNDAAALTAYEQTRREEKYFDG